MGGHPQHACTCVVLDVVHACGCFHPHPCARTQSGRLQLDEAWRTVADVFEWFILATLLPPALRNQPFAPPSPRPADHEPTSAASTPRARDDPDHLISPPTSPPPEPATTTTSGGAAIGIEALPEASVARLREDARLEASVLDALTDVALTACAQTDEATRLRLVRVLGGGMVRPDHLNLPAV